MKVYSIFNSIDGEVNLWGQGHFSTFIRLAGCNFEKRPCKYCDTKYAQSKDSGKEMSIEQIVEEVEKIGCKKVTITGGEPLLQGEEVRKLTRKLWFAKHHTSIETNGSFPLLRGVFVGSWVIDWKLTGSGMGEYMKVEHFTPLSANDFVKFVILDKPDYEEAKLVCSILRKKGCGATFAFSPVRNILNPSELIDWMKRDRLFEVIINLQLHKYIWIKGEKEV